ncbi:MAG: response regulator [Hydrogenophaga sp.]|uniref:response regulator n=1 Tax=Hydrogenophaga sp. TaxID=1904254 RepID=UPI002735CECB|nr:response regulator [Hydrogenophaga sp.]MDP3350029.1 response regulator [Hydrogenophaga sp.]
MVLVVEDDEPKLRSIVGMLREHLRDHFEIAVTESLSGAIEVLTENEVVFAIVDMSLPTYDFVKDKRGGGTPQGYGGADILRFIDSETEKTRTLVLTQYEEFVMSKDGQRRDTRSLEAMLQAELDERFLGVVHYDGQHGAWRKTLLQVLIGLGIEKDGR